MNKRTLWFLSVILPVMFLSGCMSVVTTVKLNRDGSGEIVEKIGVGKGMADIASSMSGATEEGQKSQFMDKEQLKKGADEFGKGVKFVSVSESEDGQMKFFEVVYAFDDINKVSIDQNQGSRVQGSAQQDQPNKKEEVGFNFIQGGDSSTLKIRLPKEEADDSEEAVEGATSPEMEEAELQMMKMMFKGMRFAMNIEFNGKITDTNATNVDGNTVTLFDLNFDTLMDNPEMLKKLNAKQPKGIEEAKAILQDIEGLKFELEEEIEIEFE